ncbi:MAG: SGNH/GDSL hydrolase family protein [Vicinamibacterales bacterium]
MSVRELLCCVGVVVTLVSSGACTKKENDGGTPTAPTPPPAPGAPVFYTAIGASDALGVGGSRVCLPLTPCEDGTGYVPIIVRRLADGRPVTLTNLGVPGSVLAPDTQSLARRFGRDIVANFIENELPFVPRNATLVTAFAGGNDANTIVAAVEAGQAGPDVNAFLDQKVQQFAADVGRLVNGVRDRAPNARIVVANLPNLAALPYSASAPLPRRQYLARLSAGFSFQGVNALVNQGVVVVDLLCDAQSYDRANYSSDGFHPNDRGYAFIAGKFLDALTSAAATPPRAQCPELSAI